MAVRKTKPPMKRIASKGRLSPNAKIHLKAYKDLEKEIEKAWIQLKKDVKARNRTKILKGRNNLMLLLGECDFMARECMRNLGQSQKF